MEATFYKIKLSGNVELMKKAKKLLSIGMTKQDGQAIYRTISFGSKDEVESYLRGLGVTFETVNKLNMK